MVHKSVTAGSIAPKLPTSEVVFPWKGKGFPVTENVSRYAKHTLLFAQTQMFFARNGQSFTPVWKGKDLHLKGQFGGCRQNLKSDPEPDRNVIDGKVMVISKSLYVTNRRHSMPQASSGRKHGDYLKKKIFLCR